jgi:hypothetical protein
MMRGEPEDAPLKVETSKYRRKSLEESIDDYRYLSSLSGEEVLNAWLEFAAEHDAYVTKETRETDARRARYESRLAEVRSLNFPDSEFGRGLRQFAIEQIESSIEFDCKYTPARAEDIYPGGADEWYAGRIEAALRSIEIDAKGAREEVRQNKEKVASHEEFNEFLSNLRAIEDSGVMRS